MPKQRLFPKTSKKKIRIDHTGARVRQLRTEFNLTQREFAEVLGVTAPSVLAAERTSGPLILEATVFFAETFQINPSWILLKDNSLVPKFLEQTIKQKSFNLTDLDIALNAPGVIAEKLRMQVMLLLKTVDKVMELNGKEKILEKKHVTRNQKLGQKIPNVRQR